MPRISDSAPQALLQTGRLPGLPDRDNPLAWKKKTREGRQGAHALLADLSDEEVGRYMAIAQDQIALEERLLAVKVASVIAGLALIGFATWDWIGTGFGRWDIAGLGLGLTMVYWPWRVWKCRELWQKHYEAAKAEQTRRAT